MRVARLSNIPYLAGHLAGHLPRSFWGVPLMVASLTAPMSQLSPTLALLRGWVSNEDDENVEDPIPRSGDSYVSVHDSLLRTLHRSQNDVGHYGVFYGKISSHNG